LTKRQVPFSGVGYKYSVDDIAVVTAAMSSEKTYTQGIHQEEFEKAFRELMEVKYAFATSSAATAIELVAILFDIQPGDEVIAPAHTYAASVYPFARNGASIKWADIDSKEFIVTLDTIKPLVSKKTKVIILVHLYGLPVDTSEIIKFAHENNILVLEDCAQSIGATVKGEKVGKFADAAVYSFQSHKNVSTLGEGGMLTFNRESWAKVLPGLRHNGHRPFEIDKDMYWSPAMSDVTFDLEGVWPHNFCLGEVQCALGTHLLRKVEQINLRRRERYYLALESLREFPEIQWQFIPNHKVSAHHLLPFKLLGAKYKTGADEVFKMLSQDYLVFPAKQYYPLNRYGLFIQSGNSEAKIPVTDEYYDNMVSLPFHHWMTDNDFEYILESLKKTIIALRKRA
jgi:perosamine synthetase